MKKYLINPVLFALTFFILSCTSSPPQPLPRKNSSAALSSAPVISVPEVPEPVKTTAPFITNGEKIAFMSNRSGFWDIYLMNTDGSEQTKLTNDEMKGPFAFSVSPDGKKIAYISDKSGNPDLWVIDLENKGAIQLTNTQLAEEGSPTWSADSGNIAFHSNVSDSDFYQILQVSYPLINNQPLFKIILSQNNMNLLHPAFSPNGVSLLYALSGPDGQTVLHIYDYLNKKDIPITKKEDQAINGSWSPDSRKIIYWTASNGIFQVNTDGTAKAPLGTIKNNKGTPVFSPDGTRVIIARGFGVADDFDVWMLNNDGRTPQKLTKLGGISLGWFKATGKPNAALPNAVVSDNRGSASPAPSSTTSGGLYLDPGDPLINP